MASIRKRTKTSKFWTGIYRDENGKQVWAKLSTDEREAWRMVVELEAKARKVKLGLIDPQEDARQAQRTRPIDEHITDFQNKLQAAARDEGHVATTIRYINAFAEFSGVTSAAAIERSMVDRWVLDQQGKQLANVAGYANKTINSRVASLRQFLRHLWDIGGVSRFVLAKYPTLPTGGKHRKRISRALTKAEARALLKAKGLRHHALYLFALKTGFRMNECRQVTPSCIDFKASIISLPAHATKAKKDQTIPIHADLVDTLKALCKGKKPEEPIFTLPTKQHLIEQFRKDCGRAKINTVNVSFHSLRHTFCTLLALANVHPALLQRLARHADLKTTLRYYVHLQRSDERQAINKI